jgi:hypothetical protein
MSTISARAHVLLPAAEQTRAGGEKSVRNRCTCILRWVLGSSHGLMIAQMLLKTKGAFTMNI